ncbi:uncharacterized protein LOC114540431 [Dendronephthya gigantea]|uniref:uncharacterized protein LOC114540431 n=1 Tax=Dendronephthya gigantea TaxID=151771 RepID=UPI00106B8150|nr:uncharacterized protein LOC114540431 [Dendronephthya gigantea]
MAELAGLPVPKMDWHSSDAPQAFKKFKALCELYFAGPRKGKSEAEQISYLLIWSGEEGIELVSTWSLSEDEKKKIDTYWTRFESYVSLKSNFRLARYKLLRVMMQEKDGTVDAFLKRIRIVVSECKFANTDEQIFDALVFGSNGQRVQSKLLEYDETLALNKAIDIARTEEATSSQLQDIRGEKSVNALQQNNNNKRFIQNKRRQWKDVCGNCGGKHDLSRKSSCPAQGTKCRECGMLNHWREMCRSSKPSDSKDKQERKNQDDLTDLLMLSRKKSYGPAFGGQAIEHFGTCKLALSHNDRSGLYSFHVVNTTGPTILGLSTCTDMKLVTLNYSLQCASTGNASHGGNSEAKANLLTQYADCFEGIGCFQGEYHITLGPAVCLVIYPPRRVPEALREPLKKELESLVSQGIIARVDEPTDWVNSLVCVTKSNDSLRLCLDPKDLNCATKRPHHCTPTLDEILLKLNGAKYFSIVDARSGYWNIQLDHESSVYTTFYTPHGRYRFLRLPFGLICAQDIFQKKVDEAFGDLPGVAGIADDIIVFGFKEDRSDHDSNLKAVMKQARETGVKFNPEKCKIGCTELPFFGHIICADGLKMDPRKTQAFVNMDPSKSLADLQTFLGMIQYLSRFIPNLASVSANL